jgi:hypothetical protein
MQHGIGLSFEAFTAAGVIGFGMYVLQAQVKSAGVAQLVEQRIRNAKVEGSTPFTGTI